MADLLSTSGLDMIREYIPETPVNNPDYELDLSGLPYIPSSPVYRPPSPVDYTPSAITSVPEPDQPDQDCHIRFTDPPALPPKYDAFIASLQQHTASVHLTSTASIILHPEPSGQPKVKPIPVVISNGIPPEQLSDTDLDEELQHPNHPIEQDETEGECTDQEDPDDMPPLVSDDDNNTYPPGPWNDGAKALQDNLYLLEPEPNYEEYGVPEGTIQRREILLQINSMHRCVDEVKRTVQAISNSQSNVQEISKAEILYKVNNINTTVGKMGESQNQVQDILGDFYDIIKDMKRMEDGESQNTELLQKIKDISQRINQVNLELESVKETMTKLRDSIEGHPNSRKRTYYQTVSSTKEEQDRKVKQPRLSSEINLAYLDKQYGEILVASKTRQLRKGIREHFSELHEAAKKWELLNYHLQVIYHENPELDPLPASDSEVYLKREESYLMVSLILKMYKHMGLMQKHHTDYKAFQSFLSTIFQGLVERKISAAMMYWALCQYQIHDTRCSFGCYTSLQGVFPFSKTTL